MNTMYDPTLDVLIKDMAKASEAHKAFVASEDHLRVKERVSQEFTSAIDKELERKRKNGEVVRNWRHKNKERARHIRDKWKAKNPEKYHAKIHACTMRKQQETSNRARLHYSKWDINDLVFLIKTDMSAVEAAKFLGRTYFSVISKLKRLRKLEKV